MNDPPLLKHEALTKLSFTLLLPSWLHGKKERPGKETAPHLGYCTRVETGGTPTLLPQTRG